MFTAINVITSRSQLIISATDQFALVLYMFRFTGTIDVNSKQAPKIMNNSCVNLTTFVKYRIYNHFNCEKQCHFNFAFSTFNRETLFIFCRRILRL